MFPRINVCQRLRKENYYLDDLFSYRSYLSDILKEIREGEFKDKSIGLVDRWFLKNHDKKVENQLIYTLFNNVIDSLFLFDMLLDKNHEDISNFFKK